MLKTDAEKAHTRTSNHIPYASIHTRTHVHTHTYAYSYTHTHTHTHTYTHTHTHTHTQYKMQSAILKERAIKVIQSADTL
jgi:hypothetical protein